jgi:hypothetical protein
MYTPTDAREKFCATIVANCRADECMHWRWMFDRVNVMEMQQQEYRKAGFKPVEVRAGPTGIPMVTLVQQREQG